MVEAELLRFHNQFPVVSLKTICVLSIYHGSTTRLAEKWQLFDTPIYSGNLFTSWFQVDLDHNKYKQFNTQHAIPPLRSSFIKSHCTVFWMNMNHWKWAFPPVCPQWDFSKKKQKIIWHSVLAERNSKRARFWYIYFFSTRELIMQVVVSGFYVNPTDNSDKTTEFDGVSAEWFAYRPEVTLTSRNKTTERITHWTQTVGLFPFVPIW